MHKVYLIIAFLLFFTVKNYSQNTSDTTDIIVSEQLNNELDSILNELTALIDTAEKPYSYFETSIGLGNRLFSLRNNSLNSQQITSTFVLTPTIGYFHKSGVSISGGTYLLNDDKKGFGINQYSINPAFDLPDNKKFDLGVSYTHYFVKDKYSSYSSPIQNDLYASFRYKKKWLQPGIEIGYSAGEYKQAFHKDTVINNIPRHLYDSVTSTLNSFSLIGSLSHNYEWYGVFNKKDGVAFTPSLILNTGSSETRLKHQTNAPLLVNRLIRIGKLPRLQTTPFEVQSVGINFDLNYSIGHLFIAPQLYLDYYLPETTEKRFIQTCTVSIGYTFR